MTAGVGGTASSHRCYAPNPMAIQIWTSPRPLLERPTTVQRDGDTLTIIGYGASGRFEAIRARLVGDAEPQTVPKAWLDDTTWAVRSVGDITPIDGEDLAWMRVTPGAAIPYAPDSAPAEPLVALDDVTPDCLGVVRGPADSLVLCGREERHQQATAAAKELWAASSSVVLDQEGLLISIPEGEAFTHPSGELRARLFTVGTIPTVSVTGGPASTVGSTPACCPSSSIAAAMTSTLSGSSAATKGTVPPGAAVGEMPDFLAVSDRSGAIAGYAPRDLLFARPPLSSSEQAASHVSPPVPVYADDLVTLVGYFYAGKGFIPLGADPDSVPGSPVTTAVG